jgi:hypothetical protein
MIIVSITAALIFCGLRRGGSSVSLLLNLLRPRKRGTDFFIKKNVRQDQKGVFAQNQSKRADELFARRLVAAALGAGLELVQRGRLVTFAPSVLHKVEMLALGQQELARASTTTGYASLLQAHTWTVGTLDRKQRVLRVREHPTNVHTAKGVLAVSAALSTHLSFLSVLIILE